MKRCSHSVRRRTARVFFPRCLKYGEKTNLLKDDRDRINVGNWQPASFMLMKINVDENKGRSKMSATPEWNGESIQKQGGTDPDLQAPLPGVQPAK